MNEVSKKLVCVLMKSGIEIWIEEDRAKNLKSVLPGSTSRFVELDDRMLNIAEITGIFTAEDMEDRTRRKQGQFKCKHGKWVNSEEECQRLHRPEPELPDYIRNAPAKTGLSSLTKKEIFKRMGGRK